MVDGSWTSRALYSGCGCGWVWMDSLRNIQLMERRNLRQREAVLHT